MSFFLSHQRMEAYPQILEIVERLSYYQRCHNILFYKIIFDYVTQIYYFFYSTK